VAGVQLGVFENSTALRVHTVEAPIRPGRVGKRLAVLEHVVADLLDEFAIEGLEAIARKGRSGPSVGKEA